MKTCPFCAEEIQDAAIVCKHCGRDLVAPPQPPVSAPARRVDNLKKAQGWVILLGLIGLGLVGWLVGRQDDEPLLRVSGAKGTRGLSITSREAGPLSRCRVTVLDQGNAEWTADIPGTVTPSQTVSVAWAEFTSNNQPLPDPIGRERSNFIVSCFLDTVGNTHSVGLHF